MKVAIVAPSPIPVMWGGAENLWAGLLAALNQIDGVEAEMVTLPTPERSVPELLSSYRQFAALDVSRFDWVISGKYPAWMVRHPRHIVYMLHKLRGLYDLYAPHLSQTLPLAAWRDLKLPLEVEAALRYPGNTRLEAIEIIDAVIPAVERLPVDHPALEFPGPFARALVRTLDAIGLSPDRIVRYGSNSALVRDRAEYFPAGVTVDAIHHPTSLPGLRTGPSRNIFTISRLDPPKRIDLIIRAYIASGVALPLRIAGTGPAEAELRALAGDHPGIAFLGRLDDAAVAEEYANAAFVPFMPFQEDYGLITLEAMCAGKPVVTTTDAGGVLELLRDGENGLITEPTVEAVADAFRRLSDDPDLLRRFGEQGLRDAAPITWERMTRRLLPEAHQATDPAAPAVIGRARPAIVGINTFTITPVVSGGQVRLASLYGELAKQADIRFVNLAGGLPQREERAVAPGLTEICLPVANALSRKSERLGRRLGGAGALDLAAALYPELAPEWLDALRQAALTAEMVICAHPYGHPAWTTIGLDRPMIYESFNVEYDLKAAIYGPRRAWACDAVRRIEADCIAASQAITVCSTLDGDRMRALYGLGDRATLWLPNGVSLADSVFVTAEARRAAAATIGKQRPLALFMGSTHGPNVDALPEIIAAAQACPELDFAIMGSVGQHLPDGGLPPNLQAIGMVSNAEKARWLALADIGLNPITSGSGTNLKLAEHAASGNLIVSTVFGARGGAFEPGRHYVAQEGRLADALNAALAMTDGERLAMIERARETMTRTANWEAAGRDFADLVRSLLGR